MIIKKGNVYKNNDGFEFEIVEECGVDKNHSKLYMVRFLKSGFTTIKNRPAIKRGGVKDFLQPSKHGVACLGGENLTSKHKKEYVMWSNMISRCYNDASSNKDYASYGKIGVRVSEDWLVFKNFIKDVPNIDGYDKRLYVEGVLELDKDIKQQDVPHSNRVYSLETCSFVRTLTNIKYRDSQKYKRRFVASSPDGDIINVKGIVDFAKNNDLDASTIGRCLDGEYKQHKGWTFWSVKNEEEKAISQTTIESR